MNDEPTTKRYRVTLSWTGPKPAPNKRAKSTYVIEMKSISTVEKAIAAAQLIAPWRQVDTDDSQHWKAIEVWEAVPLPDESTGGHVDE